MQYTVYSYVIMNFLLLSGLDDMLSCSSVCMYSLRRQPSTHHYSPHSLLVVAMVSIDELFQPLKGL